MALAASRDMTIKKLLLFGAALTGATLLANRDRRERLLRSTADFLENARHRLEARRQLRDTIDLGVGTGESSSGTSPSANVTTASDYPTPRI